MLLDIMRKTMKTLSEFDTLQQLCKGSGKWGLLLNIWIKEECDNPYTEAIKAAPYLADDIDGVGFIVNGGGYLLCDSKEEAYKLFYQTVGDDGPTKYNSYNGSMCKIYACLCDDKGQILTENT